MGDGAWGRRGGGQGHCVGSSLGCAGPPAGRKRSASTPGQRAARARSQDMVWWEPRSHAEILGVASERKVPTVVGRGPSSDLTLPDGPTSGCPADVDMDGGDSWTQEVIGRGCLSPEQGWNPHPVPQAPSGCTPTPNMTLTSAHRGPGDVSRCDDSLQEPRQT